MSPLFEVAPFCDVPPPAASGGGDELFPSGAPPASASALAVGDPVTVASQPAMQETNTSKGASERIMSGTKLAHRHRRTGVAAQMLDYRR